MYRIRLNCVFLLARLSFRHYCISIWPSFVYSCVLLCYLCICFNVSSHYHGGGRDSSVSIATRYRLDGPGIESGWRGEILRTRPDRPWYPPNLLHDVYRVIPGGKVARAWRWRPTPSSDEVKNRIKLCLYSPSGPSRPVIRRNLPLPLPCPISESQRHGNPCTPSFPLIRDSLRPVLVKLSTFCCISYCSLLAFVISTHINFMSEVTVWLFPEKKFLIGHRNLMAHWKDGM